MAELQSDKQNDLPQTKRLLAIMQRLRDPEKGCPWDLKQTYQTIVPYTLEEAYEVADAIEKEDYVELHGELGDLLFQVVFYAQIGQEQGDFDFESVAKQISDKLEVRHPHVFGSQQYISDQQLKINWEKQKQSEREQKNDACQSLLNDLPKSLPALSLAQKMQKRVGRHGFDWPQIDGVFEKLHEEITELKKAIKHHDVKNIEEELGDLLFTCVNLSRHLEVDAEAALRKSCRKFEERFRQLEVIISKQGLTIDTATLQQLEDAWQQAKQA